MTVPLDTLHRVLIEQLPGVVYLMKADSAEPLLYMSPQAETVLGLSHDDVLEDPTALHAHLHPEDRSRVLAERRRVAGGGAPGTIEYRFVRPDGEVVWLRDEATDMIDLEGVRYVQGIVLDVTETKRAEAERDRMELELRLAQRLEAIGQLAAGIAHEVNTPIQYLSDTTHFLEDATGDLLALLDEYRAAFAETADADQWARLVAAEHEADLPYLRERVPAAFERAFDGLERVAEIVKAMRGFAYPPSSEMAPADLNAAIRDTLTIARNSLEVAAAVETDLGDIPPVVCNVGDLGQVFLNLLVNAADAVEDSGEPGIVRISTKLEALDVVVTVSDTGCGIPAAVAEHVFQPFFTTKEVGRGTGQGLAIAHSIVQRPGGTISFAGLPVGGTEFVVRLPVAQSVAATSSADTAPSRSTVKFPLAS